jgi:hypothetical protein
MAPSNRSIMSDVFKPTGARLVWRRGAGYNVAAICTVGADTIAWDGASVETTNALYHDHHDRFSYVEIRETGRSERTHAGGIYGLKVRVRWTGAEDSGEWFDAVMVSAETIARAA